MWSFGILSLLLGSSLFADSLLASAAASVTATFNNNVQYKFDTDGNAIDSTSGKIDFFNGAYVVSEARFLTLLKNVSLHFRLVKPFK